MKNIYELLEDINIGELDINETSLPKDEKDRILKLTLNKAGLNNKKRKFNSRIILPLAATMTMILSFVVFAQGGVSNIYYNLFGENTKYISHMGTVINERVSSNGITFNVESMLGDENSFYIIFELIKENGENFKESDYVQFEKLDLDFKGSGGYTWYQVEDDNSNDNKETFILAGNTRKKITGDKLSLKVVDVTNYNVREAIESFNPYNFLLSNQEYLSQNLMENINKDSVAINKDTNFNQEEINKIDEMYRLTPNYVLPWKYANISIEKDENNIFIDNLGFVEDKLCIRFAFMNLEKDSLGDIYFENKINTEDIKYADIVLNEENDGVNYNYFIFDIKDLDELKNYEFKYNIISKKETIKGNWDVTFKVNYENSTKSFKINKNVELSNKKYTVKELKLSPIALNITLKNNIKDSIENPIHNFTNLVSVILKNGLEVEVSNSGSSTNSLSSSINIMFKKPIDPSQIDKIKIGNLEILGTDLGLN